MYHISRGNTIFARQFEFIIWAEQNTALQRSQIFHFAFFYFLSQEVLACTAMVFAGAVLSTFAPNYFWILVFSTVVGLGMGGVAQW